MKPTTFSPDFIRHHRLIAGMPKWAAESAEMAALSEDIRERGIDQPLVVCTTEDGVEEPGYLFLLDGRHRLQGAMLAGLTEVPVIYRDEADAVAIIFSSITQRRHFGKGALAYLLYPVMAADAPTHGGDRKSKSTESTLILDLCVRAGFSRDLYFQAKGVHEVFAKRDDLRSEYESRILAGEIGLGACLAGLAGKQATEGKSRNDRPPELLLRAGLSDLRKRAELWDRLDEEARKAVAYDAADTVLAMPEDVRATIIKVLRNAAK